MNSLEKILPAALDQLGLRKKVETEAVLIHWPEIAGEEIAAHTQATKVSRGVLLVAVSSPVWSHHLLMIKETILAKIQAYTGQKVIKDIRFHAGYLKNSQNQENKYEQEETSEKYLIKTNITGDEYQKIRQIAGEASDELLRNKLITLLEKEWTLRKYRMAKQWKKCGNCSALCPPEKEYCQACTVQKSEQLKKSIRKILAEAPWIGYKELSQYIACTPAQYFAARTELIARLSMELAQENQNRLKAAMLTMLVLNLKPEGITPAMIDKTLEKSRRKKYVFTSGR